MSSCGGYAGKLIRIDLSSESFSEYSWNDLDRERYLGGKTMAAQILLDCSCGRETAFSEESCVVITTGPLTGTGAPGSARFDIASLSPRGDTPVFSNCGGTFGIWLKKAGYDGLILTGTCRKKRWLEISAEKIVFHDAGMLWGTGAVSCREMLRQILGREQFGSLCIGPAGENLVEFASVLANGHSTGRAGVGAVLGYKNLKAITVFGNKEIRIHDPEGAAAYNADWHICLKQKAQTDRKEKEKDVCQGCPLHCSRHEREDDGVLNELGMDSIVALDTLRWAEDQGIATENLYEDIACRRGIGDALAEGIYRGKKTGGKRRGGGYRSIAAALGMVPEKPETDLFCRWLTEAISAAGQCMFTANGFVRSEDGGTELPVVQMLTLVTGRKLDLANLVEIGKRSFALEQQLNRKFDRQKK